MNPKNVRTRESWNHYPLWLLLGCALITLVVTLSVVSFTQPVQIEGGDKYEHFLAYATLMYWWGMLQPGRRWPWALALTLMGVGLEFVQHLLPERQMDWLDALANTSGVVVAGLVLLTPLEKLLPWVDRQFSNRLGPGRS
jgi:VanZ family protein